MTEWNEFKNENGDTYWVLHISPFTSSVHPSEDYPGQFMWATDDGFGYEDTSDQAKEACHATLRRVAYNVLTELGDDVKSITQ